MQMEDLLSQASQLTGVPLQNEQAKGPDVQATGKPADLLEQAANLTGIPLKEAKHSLWQTELESMLPQFGLAVSSRTRPGAMTSTGKPSLHSIGQALDIDGSPAKMAELFDYLRENYGDRIRELIYTPKGAVYGGKYVDPQTMLAKDNKRGSSIYHDHFSHLHVSLKDGGSIDVGSRPQRSDDLLTAASKVSGVPLVGKPREPQGPSMPEDVSKWSPEAIRAFALKKLGKKPAEHQFVDVLYSTNREKVENSLTKFSSFHSVYDLANAMRDGQKWIKSEEGITSVRAWKKHLANSLGVKPEQITNKTIARLVAISPVVSPNVKTPELGGLYGWLNSLMPEGKATYFGTVGAMSRAVGDVPRLIQEGATRALTGGKIGEKELNEDLSGGLKISSEVGKGVGNLATYFAPGVGQARLISDIGGIGGQAIEQRNIKPVQEAGQAILDSFKVLDPDIEPSERIMRWINVGGAVLGGAYIVGKGGKALTRAQAVKATFSALKREAQAIPELAKLTDKEIRFIAEGAAQRVLDSQSTAKTVLRPRSTIKRAAVGPRQIIAATTEPTTFGGPVLAKPGAAGAIVRPSIEPIQGSQAVNPDQIIDELAKDLRTSTPDNTRPFTRGALGEYDPNSTAKRLKWANDLDTAAHELGHHVDNVNGLLDKAKLDPAVVKELENIGQRTSMPSHGPDQVLQEGIAEALRDFAFAPGELTKTAPAVEAFIRKNLTPNQLAALEKFGKNSREYAGATATEQLRANLHLSAPDTGPRWWEQLTQAFKGESWDPATGQYRVTGKAKALITDESAPIKQAWRDAMRLVGLKPEATLPSEDVAGLIDDLRYVRGKVGDVIENGMINAKGKRVGVPLKEIFQRLWTGDKDALIRDFEDAMTLGVAQRVAERSDLITSEARKTLTDRAKSVRQTLKDQRQAIRDQHAREVAIAKAGRKPSKRLDAIIKKLDKDRDKALNQARRDAHNSYRKEKTKLQNQAQKETDALTGVDAGLGLDGAAANAKKVITELQANPERFSRLQASLDAYRDHADKLLQYARDAGRISSKQYDEIRGSNQQYIAMQRLFGDTPHAEFGGGALGSAKKIYYKFKGSKRTIANPFESLVEQTAKVIQESDRNRVMAKLTDALNKPARESELASIGRRVNDDYAGQKFKVYRDGQEEWWAFHDDLNYAIKHLGRVEFRGPGALVPLAFLAKLVTSHTTSWPRYLVRNFMRDTTERLVRRGGGRPRWGTAEEISDYHRLGGGISQSELVNHAKSYYDIQTRLLDEVTGTGPKNAGGKAARTYKELKEASERSNRIAEMRRAYAEAIDKGLSPEEAKIYAARSAREVLDFTRGGTWVKALNQYVPFTNSTIQGLASLGRDFMRNPTKVGVRFITRVGMVETAVYYWNQSQGATEEWRQQPDYLRDFFWLIKVPGHGFATIPKPFEVGVAASAFSRAFDSIAGNEKAFDGYAHSATSSLMGPVTSITEGGGAQGVIGAVTNRDLFRGQSIVDPDEDKLRLDLRKGKSSASTAAQMVGNVIQVDPRKIDYLAQSQLGDTARTIAFGSDVLSGRKDKGITTPERTIDTFAGVAKETPGNNAKDVQWVMDTAASVGLSKVLKAERDAVRTADTEAKREAAKAKLRARATMLRARIERLTAGKSGEAFKAAVKAALGVGG